MKRVRRAAHRLDQPATRLAAGLLALMIALPACGPIELPGQQGGGQEETGPGRRSQALVLTPEQELRLGRHAYREILAKSRALPRDSDEVRRVTRVGERITRAAMIEPLQREINLHFDPAYMEWEFNVLEDEHVNAFCLPGGKVAVFTGLLRLVENDDDYLATVLSHEIAHALAHHANERIASQELTQRARSASGEGMGSLDAGDSARLIEILAGIGSQLHGLSAARRQESEADHIGLFLMAFANYNPEKAVLFWDRMLQVSQQRGAPIELLSDHPSDARRIAQIQAWGPQALGARNAFDEGKIAPEGRSR